MRINVFINYTFHADGVQLSDFDVNITDFYFISFHFISFLLRDARSAKRGIAIVSRPSGRLSVRLSITLMFEINYTSN